MKIKIDKVKALIIILNIVLVPLLAYLGAKYIPFKDTCHCRQEKMYGITGPHEITYENCDRSCFDCHGEN